MILRACLTTVLSSALDDWVQAAEVTSIARTVGAMTSESAARDLSLQLIQHLLELDLVEVGTVTEEGGFKPWNSSVTDAMRRMESEWRTHPRGPGLGEACWLNLTEKGQIQAQELRLGKGEEVS